MAKSAYQNAMTTYNVGIWGDNYFGINAAGEVTIHPQGSHNATAVSFTEVCSKIQQAGLQWPVLVRFPDILHHRINTLCDTFNKVSAQLNYLGKNTAVYPIKVNQQRRVVEEILATKPASSNSQIGLEAGSKPELIAVLANCSKNTTIVCNGYKDREFIQLALTGQAMGHRIYIVVEKPGELDLILEQSQQLGVLPAIGIRVKLASIGKGNWQNTGGEKSKFGLLTCQILELVNLLKQRNLLNHLQLLHFHLGSQIANIRDIQKGLKECARFYSELLNLGARIEVVDVGGGLGVDYEGTRSRSACSVNYSLHEYAYHVLRTLKDECDLAKLPHPDVITESGRAMTAHHAVLIADIVEQERSLANKTESKETTAPSGQSSRDISVLRELEQTFDDLTNQSNPRSYVEIYYDATHSLEEAQHMFIHGILNLEQRSAAEQRYRQICEALQAKMSWQNRTHREILDILHQQLADKIFLNFSLF
jgi:arginine decarboxylase